ncbi:hypothetical protein MES4922_300181 [Mesorhizobium ventifaucium]|uniref:Guanylate cyclase domain-containing protein n=1 Tax=Mesorhizobium ventifaucium TaxID=666020 RepID=A0ABM9E1U8_9HYPH|nr:hypothetical protein MES4922_300181 [Mesorhizobium ventifaucium]
MGVNTIRCPAFYESKCKMAEERAQRRLAAIMAADVVGYSRLVELDEQGTLATLRSGAGESWSHSFASITAVS